MIVPIVCLASIALGADDLSISIDADAREVRVLDEVAITVHATAPLGWEVRCGAEGLQAGDLAGEDDGILQIVDVVKATHASGDDVEWTWRVRASGYAPGKARVGPWPVVARRIDGEETAAATTDALELTVVSLLTDDGSFEAGALRPGVIETHAGRGAGAWILGAAAGAGIAGLAVGAWAWRARHRRRPGDDVVRAFARHRRDIESSDAGARLRVLREAMALAGIDRASAAVGSELAELVCASSLEQDEQSALLCAFSDEERAAYAGAQGASRADLEEVLQSLERASMRQVTEAIR